MIYTIYGLSVASNTDVINPIYGPYISLNADVLTHPHGRLASPYLGTSVFGEVRMLRKSVFGEVRIWVSPYFE